MDYEVVWTEEATADFDAIVNYFAENTIEKSTSKFVSTFYRKLDLLVQMPYMGIKSVKRRRGQAPAYYKALFADLHLDCRSNLFAPRVRQPQ